MDLATLLAIREKVEELSRQFADGANGGMCSLEYWQGGVEFATELLAHLDDEIVYQVPDWAAGRFLNA